MGFGGVSRVVGFVSYQTVSFRSFKCERQLDLQLQDCGLEAFREFLTSCLLAFQNLTCRLVVLNYFLHAHLRECHVKTD